MQKEILVAKRDCKSQQNQLSGLISLQLSHMWKEKTVTCDCINKWKMTYII